MYLWTLTLLIVLICTLYYYFKKQLGYFEDRDVPYVAGWPVFGNMAATFFRRKHITETVSELYNAHPDAKYVGFFEFGKPMIMLRDHDLIKSVSIKHFDHFPDHPLIVSDKIDPLFAGNLFAMSGERWREARNLLSPAFTSSRMKAMHGLMVERVKIFMGYLRELPDSQLSMLSTKDLFTRFTNDAIASCAFGISVDSLKNPDNEFYVLGKEATNLDGLFTFKLLISRSWPALLRWFNVRFVSQHVVEFFENVVGSMVKTRDEEGISRPDMLQLMMDARGKTSEHLTLDITDMTAQAFVFFFGGFDTTSTQMCIIAHELAINPEIQAKLQDEIDRAMETSNGNPSYDDIHGMPYLDAVFNESMRRHTQVPFVDRLCTKPFELPASLPGAKPFTIPAGMCVWLPVAGIFKDPKYYDKPEIFNPDRYYEKRVSINDVTNLAFGIGPRSCIGNRFAILETKVLLVYLLSKFNLKANEKTCSPLKYTNNSFSVTAEGGFWLAIEKRE